MREKFVSLFEPRDLDGNLTNHLIHLGTIFTVYNLHHTVISKQIIHGGPAKVRPTYIFAGSIWMRRQNSMIFGNCKLHTTRSGVMQILSKFLS